MAIIGRLGVVRHERRSSQRPRGSKRDKRERNEGEELRTTEDETSTRHGENTMLHMMTET
jgi:hypothetical protein